MASQLATGFRQAVHENFPNMAIHTWQPLHEGWGNQTFLANQNLVFRFPKHQDAARGLLREIRLLTELAPQLPLAIPRYEYIGQPTSHFPFAFGGYPFIPGEPLSQYINQERDARWWQQPLGEFLSALHRFPTERAKYLLQDDVYTTSQAWYQACVQMCTQVRARIFPLLSFPQQQVIGDYLDSVMNNPTIFTFEPVLLHQDFHPQNILVNYAHKQVTGVIDWSNCTIGDPAEDVGNLWQYYTGMVDPGWHSRLAFYTRTMPFPDLLYVLDYGPHDKVIAITEKIANEWTS